MPLSYAIDAQAGLVTITGEYAPDPEWRRLLASVLDDPDFRPGLSYLRDLRGARSPVDGATVMRIIAVVGEFWPRLQASRAAIVTPRSVDTAALIAHALADDRHLPLRAFTSYEAAIEWLQEELVRPRSAGQD